MTAANRVTLTTERGCSIVRLHGEVDHANAGQIEIDVLTATRAGTGTLRTLRGR